MTAPSNEIYPRLLQLASCLCAVAEDELDPLCFCGLMPGAVVARDYVAMGCDDRDGMAWVRLVTAAPKPSRSGGPTNCDAELIFSAQVGIIRSMPLGDGGEPPDAAQMEAAVERQITEMAAMRKAIICCYGREVILGSYVPEGPEGGAIGGTWTVTVPTLADDDL